MVNDMAANEETVSIDTVKKTLWDSLEALGENISGETLETLLEIIAGGGGGSTESNVEVVPFVLTVDPDTHATTATTEYDFGDALTAVTDGKILICDAVLNMAGEEKHICAIGSSVKSAVESESVIDFVNVDYTKAGASIVVDVKIVSWTNAGVEIYAATLGE